MKSLIVDVGSIPTNLNETLSAGSGSVATEIDSIILPRAFYLDHGGNYVLDTRYVTSAEVVSVSPQIIVYKINTKTKWSDGHQLSALDFIYTWEAQRGGLPGPTQPYLSLLSANSDYPNVSSVESNSSGSAVTVRFARPDSSWRTLFNPVLPARYLQAHGFVASMSLGQDLFPTVGDYTITSYQSEEVLLKAVAGTPAAFSAIDFVSDRTRPTVGASSPSIRVLGDPARLIVNPIYLPGSVLYQAVFNLNTTSLAFRRALAYAIDRPKLYESIVGNGPLGELRIYSPGNNLYVSSQLGYDNNQGGYAFGDIAKAERSAFISGLSYSASGLLEPLGGNFSVNLVYDSSDPIASAIANSVSTQLNYFGIAVTRNPVPNPAMVTSRVSNGDFTVAIRALSMVNLPGQLVSDFVSGSMQPLNITGDFPGNLALIAKQANQQLYPLASSKLYDQLDSYIWQDMAALPLMNPPIEVELSQPLSPTELVSALEIISAPGFESTAPIVLSPN